MSWRVSCFEFLWTLRLGRRGANGIRKAYLGTRPGRFEYVHTPKHGSWLNLIECAFAKMARTFLRHIRVTSVDKLKTRILKGIDEFNASPVVFRWNKFDLGVA